MVRRAWRASNRRRACAVHGTRCAVVLALLATLALATSLSAAATFALGDDGPAAHFARVLTVHDEGHLRFVSSSGSQLIDEGTARGSLPGKVRLHFTYDGSPTVRAQFTVRGANWSIQARAQGRLSNPTSPRPSFRGSLVISSGSGRYAHARGGGELFGVFSRRDYGLTVQAIGKLTY
jgi:hypothetical protein